ncbi:MAG: MFS transporter [candidate division WOR-3 bacterium]|nr:MFS transporter [candidate division WOR-3 bacterium]MCX7836716.1 MFS transporter [candidate division WOR-3 bacterium]MDW8113447.1 MFS transporter [candidate division WOR-3 bacterium]
MIFSISQAFSLFGDKLDYMAILALISFLAQKKNIDTSRAISFFSVVITLPTILFGPFAGIFVDRWDKRKILIYCDFFRALLVAFIPFLVLHTFNLSLIYIICFFVFLFGLFFNATRLSILPYLVAKRRLLAANSFNNLLGRIATLSGMLVGGFIVDWQIWKKIGISYGWAAGFYIDSFTYWVSVFTLIYLAAKIKIRKTTLENLSSTGSKKFFSLILAKLKLMVEDLKNASKFILKTPKVQVVMFSVFLFVILGAGALVLYVPIIQESEGLKLGTSGVGFLGTIGSIGLILSSLTYGIWGYKFDRQLVLLISFFLFGVLTIILSFTKIISLVILLIFICGFLLSPIFVIQDTILQENVPEELRGKIFALKEWFLHLFFGIFAFLIGQLTYFFPRARILSFIGGLVIFSSLLIFFIYYNQKELT